VSFVAGITATGSVSVQFAVYVAVKLDSSGKNVYKTILMPILTSMFTL
jgi:tRNA threonylcarbamoyladenosine modification (KEOPS) complex Cgi121 subunit